MLQKTLSTQIQPIARHLPSTVSITVCLFSNYTDTAQQKNVKNKKSLQRKTHNCNPAQTAVFLLLCGKPPRLCTHSKPSG